MSVVSEISVFSRSIERQFSAWGYDTVPFDRLGSQGEAPPDILVMDCVKPETLECLQRSNWSAFELPRIIVCREMEAN